MSTQIQSAVGAALRWRTPIANRLQNLNPLVQKGLESAALFLVMGAIYSFYLQSLWSVPGCSMVVFNLAYLFVLLKFVFLTGWPFALMAFLDDTWTSKDAGRVFLAAFVATNWFWMRRYHHSFCPYSFAFEIFPYVFSAVVAHAIGAWPQALHDRAEVTFKALDSYDDLPMIPSPDASLGDGDGAARHPYL